MSTAHELLQATPAEAVRRICLSLLDDARATMPRLDDPKDTEALHDFRVAVRKLRSTIRAWRPTLKGSVSRKHRDRLRGLQHETGGGRDAEVALAWVEAEAKKGLHPVHRLGVSWFGGRLNEAKRSAMTHVRSAIRTRFERLDAQLRPRLETITMTVHLGADDPTPRFASALAGAVQSHVDDLARQLVQVASADEVEALHDARIACKRLRYLLEPAKGGTPEVASAIKTTKKLQELLGLLNDAFVLRGMLRAGLEESAVERARLLYDLVLEPDTPDAQREMRRTERPGLLELTRRNEDRIKVLFDKVERNWIETAAAPLVKSIDKLARKLQAADGGAPDVEIERKYLLAGMPDLSGLDVQVQELRQGYLPGESIRERVRSKSATDGTVTYYRTIKAGQGVRRIEVEETCTEEVFETLWALTEGARVTKSRYVVREGDDVWELDAFSDRELFLAEIELDDPDQSIVFPAWLEPMLIREVTDETGFTNLELAS